MTAPPVPAAPHISCSRGEISASCPPASWPCRAPAALREVPHQLACWYPRTCARPSSARVQSKSKKGRRGGEESFLHPQGFCPQSRAHKYPLPTHSITLSVEASASSHSGGKMVLLVAIIKTGRGRHLLFSATAEIALLTQTFWSWIILKCLCRDHQQVSPSRLTLSLLQLWVHPIFFWSQASAEDWHPNPANANTHTPCNTLLSQHRPNLICKRRERSLDLREGEGMRRRNKQTNDETTDGSLLSAATALVFLNTCCSLTHLLKHLRPSSHLHGSNLPMFIVS